MLRRLIQRRIAAASPAALARYTKRLAPAQRLVPQPGWTFDAPAYRDDIGTWTRRLIWNRYHHEQIDMPARVRWCGRLRLNLRVGNDVGWCVFVGGAYEPNELAWVATKVKPGMTVIDVGANEGLYTLVAAWRVGPAGQVVAVEPSSRERNLLQANIALNRLRNIDVAGVALHDRAGTGRLTRAGFGHEGQNTIGDHIPNPGVTADGTEPVELETLDGISAHLDQVDLVKLDAEGCEQHIIEGARQTLRRHRPSLLVEISPEHLAAHGSSVEGLIELLHSAGYRISVFAADGRPKPWDGRDSVTGNIIATAQTRGRLLS